MSQFKQSFIQELSPHSLEFIKEQGDFQTPVTHYEDPVKKTSGSIYFTHSFKETKKNILCVTRIYGIGQNENSPVFIPNGKIFHPVLLRAQEFDKETGLLNGRSLTLWAGNSEDLAQKIVEQKKDVTIYQNGNPIGTKTDYHFARYAQNLVNPKSQVPQNLGFFDRIKSTLGIK
jgi:hypothetical protein